MLPSHQKHPKPVMIHDLIISQLRPKMHTSSLNPSGLWSTREIGRDMCNSKAFHFRSPGLGVENGWENGGSYRMFRKDIFVGWFFCWWILLLFMSLQMLVIEDGFLRWHERKKNWLQYSCSMLLMHSIPGGLVIFSSSQNDPELRTISREDRRPQPRNGASHQDDMKRLHPGWRGYSTLRNSKRPLKTDV